MKNKTFGLIAGPISQSETLVQQQHEIFKRMIIPFFPLGANTIEALQLQSFEQKTLMECKRLIFADNEIRLGDSYFFEVDQPIVIRVTIS